MNDDINTMLELQEYWDKVLNSQNEIIKFEKSISFWKNEQEEKKNQLSLIEQKIKEYKITINKKEIELNQYDDQIKNLEKKKYIVKSEKEINALDHELEKAKSDRDLVENELLELFDLVENTEKNAEDLKNESIKFEKQSSADIIDIENKISAERKIIDDNRNSFETSTNKLSPTVKARFLKLIKSQNGKAIAQLKDQICGVCNFQVPFNLIQDLSKENAIVNCTNCGRFLYI